MIVYQNTKAQFVEDVISNDIENIILNSFQTHLGRTTGQREINSWKNSMQYMSNVMQDSEIPADASVAIEFQIPQTSKRIDFILAGLGESSKENVIIIELKQWSKAEMSDKDGVVISYVGQGLIELTHPSYQAWSYSSLLRNFNEAVYEGDINIEPCAYLHNYVPDNKIDNECYAEYISRAPLFLKHDVYKLRDFIKRFIKQGDSTDIMVKIENGRIRPSKHLADSLTSMIKGNQEFVMIDDQKVVFETAIELAHKASVRKKQVLIVKGGPGTGKSVVAINLLVELTKQRLFNLYVTKNTAPRAVYEKKLKGDFKKKEIDNLFSGSGAFINEEPNIYDALIIDEAHRLNEKSGMFKNLGENQVKELIAASKCTVFFIDEDQRVTIHDIGQIDELMKWAESFDANVTELELASQFRCNGSDGYLSWLDQILQIRETANTDLQDIDFDFQVVDSPTVLRDMIIEKNRIANKARLVAGYCWKWESKKQPKAMDIEFPEYDFAMQWNLTKDGSLWIVSPNSINEIGCIHTCQGLELDYVGVIIGDDLIVRDGKVVVDPSKRDSNDSSVRGWRGRMEQDPDKTLQLMDMIIKNTYKTLLTRGMKGCYVYCTDKETEEYFEEISTR